MKWNECSCINVYTCANISVNWNSVWCTAESFDPSDDVCKIVEAAGICEPDACVEANGTASCK